jgi:Bacterial PH domain
MPATLSSIEANVGSFTVSSPYNIATELQSEMGSGESLLWSGQPQQKVIFHQQDWFAIPFSLMWGGFAIFWECGVTGFWGNSEPSHAAPGFFALWGIPFVVIGQYLIWGRFLYTGWKKARTYYGVTNKRVLVLNTGSSRRVTDAYFSSIDSVSLTSRPDGIGTIEFAPEPSSQSVWSSNSRRGRGNQLGIDLSRLAFFDINDARNVYQLIQSQREKTRP